MSVYFGGPIPLPNAETVAIVTSCVSNEPGPEKYPADVKFEAYRSEPTIANPNAIFAADTRSFTGPGFADQRTHTISNLSGTVTIFHVRVLAEKSIARGLLCRAHFTDSTTAPTYSTSLPLERRGKLVLPKDVR